MTIDVQDQDIEGSTIRHPLNCFAARAIKRVVGKRWYGNIYVDGLTAHFVSYDWQTADFKVNLPDEVRVKILEFDHGFKPQPFSFELPVCTAS